MGAFDDIMQSSQAPQAPGGVFDDIITSEPADFGQRFQGDDTAKRPGMAAPLEGYAQALMGMPSRTEAGVLGFARGNTMEFVDEAAAGVNAAIDTVGGQEFGPSYDRHLAHGRQRIRDASVAHPGTTMAGQVAGSVLTPTPIRGGGAAVNAAIQGGITGIGSGEGFSDRLAQGTIGTVAGAAIGKGVETVTRSGRAMLNYGRNAIQSLVRPHAAAGRKISGAMAEDVQNGSQVIDDQAFAQAQHAGYPVAAVDQGGQATRALARSAADTSPDAVAALEGVTRPRFESQAGRAEALMQSMFGQEIADTAARRAQLELQGQLAMSPMYNRAYAAGDRDIWDETLAGIANTSLGQQALKNAITRASDYEIANGFMPMNPRVSLDDAQRVVFQKGGMPSYPNVQLWDYTKRELDKMARGANADPLAGQMARRLREHLDGIVPEYGQARGVAQRELGAQNALEAGENFVRSKLRNEETRALMQRMSAPDRELFAEGFAGRLVREVREIGTNRNITIDKIFNAPAAQERLEIALGPQRARELEVFLRTEHAMDLVRNAVEGNSKTARYLNGRDYAFKGMAGLAGGALIDQDFDPTDPTSIIAGLMGAGVAGANRRVAAEVGRRLASNDPALMREAMRTVANSRTLTRQLRQVESRLAKSLAPLTDAAAQKGTDLAIGGLRKASGADPEKEKQR